MIARSSQIASATLSLCWLTACAAYGQAQPSGRPASGSAPIYQVTVIERTTKAVNYRYRAEPTVIDFAGTVLMPKAKGSAVVASKQGRTEIDVNFQHLTAPTPLGREFLTYVLWALTPEGRPHNLGEVITNSHDSASLRVSTDLQAFALIVTAEPYSAVRSPGDVVVLENQVRPETTGLIEQVNARYELLPRGHYTLDRGNGSDARKTGGPTVSTREYEVLLELYQAENAINIAKAARAGEAAGDILARAEALLNEAKNRHDHKGDRTLILQQARQATQTAEDARIVADEHYKQDHSTAALRAEASQQREAQIAAQNEASRARADRAAAEQQLQRTQAELQASQQNTRAQLEAERAARLRAEADLAAIQKQREAAATPTGAADTSRKRRAEEQKALRVRVLDNLNATLPALDTPRGLVATVVDSSFSGANFRADVAQRVRRVATTLATYRNLNVTVEGYSNASSNDSEAADRAMEVASVLRAGGVQVSVRNMRNQRPVGPGHLENARVEIVVSGEALGDMPAWDRSYSLSLR